MVFGLVPPSPHTTFVKVSKSILRCFFLLFFFFFYSSKKRVALNGHHSRVYIERSQGYVRVHGSLIFSMQVIDLPKNIFSNPKVIALYNFFLFSVLHHPIRFSGYRNRNVSVIKCWTFVWKINFSPNATRLVKKVLTFLQIL